MLVHLKPIHAQKPQNITLIGMPGSGKSSVARWFMENPVPAARLKQVRVLDTDELMVKEIGRRGFLELEGRRFVLFEEKTVLSLGAKIDGCAHNLISTGGSVIYGELAMQYLREISFIIFLESSVETVLRRVGWRRLCNRAIVGLDGLALDKDDVERKFARLHQAREGLYMKYADAQINVDNAPVPEVAIEIARLISD